MSNISLQSIALKSFLENTLVDLLQDDASKATLMTFFKEHLFSQCLQSSELYHVYCRSNYDGNNALEYIKLLNTFPTELEAAQWILERGPQLMREIEGDLEDIITVPLVLTIISNDENKAYDICVAHDKYPIFAFSCKSHRAAMHEYSDRADGGVNPYWITCINSEGIVTRGWTKNNMKYIHANYRRSKHQWAKDKRDFAASSKDGNAWVIACREAQLIEDGYCPYHYY
jgi:hypothetical protein